MGKVPMGPPPPRLPEDTTKVSMGPPPPVSKQVQTSSDAITNATEIRGATQDDSESQNHGGNTQNSETTSKDTTQNDETTSQDTTQDSETTHQDTTQENSETQNQDTTQKSSEGQNRGNSGNQIYQIPPWSEPPGQPFFLEVVKEGTIIDNLDVSEKGAYMFGRNELCDFVLEHPSLSRFHAVLQFNGNGEAYLYDLGSTHGSFVNKVQVKPKKFRPLNVGDVLRFGQSTRLYILQGPTELMPPEKVPKAANQQFSDMHSFEDKIDMEASLLRAKLDASLAEGISWGMSEDAVEEKIREVDEITWQTYKGQLTERQEKTLDKIVKRMEKLANLRKEIDAIQAKEIAQGGLTQGQQTQIARNEQRIEQIAEEVENLEETLNQSIQESVGARSGISGFGRKKQNPEEEDDLESDDDDFYDRTKKGQRGQKYASKEPVVETAESLVEKKESLSLDIEATRVALEEEKLSNSTKHLERKAEADDPLDAFMTGVSTQLVKDRESQLEQKLEALQTEMERVLYLLKIADPTGEASQKKQSQTLSSKGITILKSKDVLFSSKKNLATAGKKPKSIEQKTANTVSVYDTDTKLSAEATKETTEKCTTNSLSEESSMLKKPVWLGAVDSNAEKLEKLNKSSPVEEATTDKFISYKERKQEMSLNNNNHTESPSFLENAKGLIIRKPKNKNPEAFTGEEGKEGLGDLNGNSSSISVNTEESAVDAVALLLRHKRGLGASDDGSDDQEQETSSKVLEPAKKKSRKLGPEKPKFLNPDDSWVPPQGQTGDGRTSLNDRYGY